MSASRPPVHEASSSSSSSSSSHEESDTTTWSGNAYAQNLAFGAFTASCKVVSRGVFGPIGAAINRKILQNARMGGALGDIDKRTASHRGDGYLVSHVDGDPETFVRLLVSVGPNKNTVTVQTPVDGKMTPTPLSEIADEQRCDVLVWLCMVLNISQGLFVGQVFVNNCFEAIKSRYNAALIKARELDNLRRRTNLSKKKGTAPRAKKRQQIDDDDDEEEEDDGVHSDVPVRAVAAPPAAAKKKKRPAVSFAAEVTDSLETAKQIITALREENKLLKTRRDAYAEMVMLESKRARLLERYLTVKASLKKVGGCSDENKTVVRGVDDIEDDDEDVGDTQEAQETLSSGM